MIDLHIHTSYSDGEYNENEIIQKVIEANLTEFCICDHDNIEGSLKVCNILKNSKSKLKFHSGMEVTARINNFLGGINIHLLARDFDYNSEYIIKIVDEMKKNRQIKKQRLVDYIKKVYNFVLPTNEVEEVNKTTLSFGKPHAYKILSKHINVNMEEYYKNMKKLDTDDLKIDALKVIEYVHKAGGNVTLAHPIEIMDEYNLEYEDIDKIVAYLSSFNLDGLETQHSKHTYKDYIEFSKIADKYNLKQSRGSDYHGPNVKPNINLGICKKR